MRAFSPSLGRWAPREGQRFYRTSSTPSICPHCQRRGRPVSVNTVPVRRLSSTPVQKATTPTSSERTTESKNLDIPSGGNVAAEPNPDAVVAGGTGGEFDPRSEQDERDYRRAMLLEDREAYQHLVDKALDHSEYRPAATAKGLKRVGGNYHLVPPQRTNFTGCASSIFLVIIVC